ncbi:conserved exported hypothetical protein [Frankia canadensis]|uniref:Secreted protein n=1 Tax=Frankia canadensis TaxID=1836972 RepID=A0A2I2KQ37_9ACTN|nr:conserved exported hypothetical protein [Frankia canadensis]SOU55064.1 conserved exported hypothetical protein [Frankia canadensis]
MIRMPARPSSAPVVGRLTRGTVALVALLAALVTVATTTPADAATRSCSGLSGDGSYSHPYRLGTVRGSIVIRRCPPLISGAGYNTAYFSFALSSTARPTSYIGARFTLGRNTRSAVNPRLLRGALTVIPSSAAEWTGSGPNYTGRYLYLAPLASGGNLRAGGYTLAVGKLDSPLRSTSTPSYDLVLKIR